MRSRNLHLKKVRASNLPNKYYSKCIPAKKTGKYIVLEVTLEVAI